MTQLDSAVLVSRENAEIKVAVSPGTAISAWFLFWLFCLVTLGDAMN